MSVELASAYVSLVPSAKGIGAAIASELDAPLSAASKSSGEAASKSFGGSFVSGIGSVGKVAAAGLLAGFAGAGALAAIGGTFDDAFDTIRIKTGATGDELEGLSGSFKTVFASLPVSADDASAAIAGLNAKLDITGKPLEDLSKQVLNLSRVTGTDLSANVESVSRLFGDWGVATGDQAASLDKLFRASQASGIGVTDLAGSLVQFGAPFRNLGFSFDQSTALLAQFNKTGVNTDTVVAGLKAGVGKLAKAGEDVPTTFQRVVEEITKLGPGSEATGKAIALFGQRAGPDLADAITGGKFAIDDMLGAIAGGSDTINAAAADTDDWKESLKVLGNSAMVALEPIATRVFNGLSQGIDYLAPRIASLSGWFSKSLIPAVTSVAEWIGDNLVPALRSAAQWLGGVFLKAITAVSSWISGHWDQIKAIIMGVFNAIVDGGKGVAKALQATFGFLMDHKAEVVGALAAVGVVVVAAFGAWAISAGAAAVATIAATLPLVALVAGVMAIGAALVYAYTHFDTFRNIVDAVARFLRDELWPAIQTVFSGIVDVVRVAISVVTGIIQTGIGIVRGVWETFGGFITGYLQGVWTSISGIVQGALDVVVGIFNLFKDLFTGNWSKLWDDLKLILSGVWEIIKGIVQGAVDQVTAILGAAWAAIQLAAETVWNAISTVATSTWNAIKGAITGPINEACDVIGGIWGTIQAAAETAWAGFKGAAIRVWNTIYDVIIKPIKDLVGDIVGVWNTIKRDAGRVWEEIQSVIKSPIDAIKGFIQGIIDKVQALIGKAIEVKDKLAELRPSWLGGPGDVNGKLGAGFPGNAGGTPDWRGGPTWVGENGPELAWLPRHTAVLPNPESMALAADTTGGGPLIAHAEFHSDVDVDGFFRYAQFLSGAAAA